MTLVPSAFSLLLFLAPAAPVKADYLIQGVTIYDGTNRPAVQGNLAIKGDRIVGVGSFEFAGKPKIINAAGLIVAPGFIDLHSHSDISLESGKSPIVEPQTRANLNYLKQGVTTIVTGNCGFGPVDVADYLKKVDERKPGTNVIHLIPHNDLRKKVMGNANRPPTHEELEKMKGLTDDGMRAGAWGFSTGLYYTPGSYSDTDEIVELAKVVAAHGGIYATHMRNEGIALLPSINETLEIGRRAGLPVHISHMKAWTRKAWDKAVDAAALVHEARAKGQAVTADQYPYTAGSSWLSAMVIPTTYREGSQKDLVARFDDPTLGPKVRQGIQQLLNDFDGGKTIRIASYPKKAEWQGKDLVAIAERERRTPLEIVLEIQRNGDASAVNFGMNEEGVRIIMKQPFVATASDGMTMLPSDAAVHPRSYGCFPRKIGRYAIEEKLVSVEQAIHSASGLPADILRLPERGYLKPGYIADIVVFDPSTFRDTATYERPHQYATGVRYLFVNGVLAIKDGKYTEALAGKAIRRTRS